MTDEKDISIEFDNEESRGKQESRFAKGGIEREESFSEQADDAEERAEQPDAEKRIAELEERLVRTLADFDNYRKRSLKFQEELTKAANDKIIRDLLEVIDNFERAAEHSETADLATLKQGLQLIHSQFMALLNQYNITPIEALGKPFDATLHEALMKVDTAEYPEGHVAMEVNKGYKQGERVIRHSRVGVSSGKLKKD